MNYCLEINGRKIVRQINVIIVIEASFLCLGGNTIVVDVGMYFVQSNSILNIEAAPIISWMVINLMIWPRRK